MKYENSSYNFGNIFRQMVARSIVETAQAVTTQQECLALLEIVTKLSQDVGNNSICK